MGKKIKDEAGGTVEARLAGCSWKVSFDAFRAGNLGEWGTCTVHHCIIYVCYVWK